MATALVTGSGGLIGSETVRRLHELGWDVVGIGELRYDIDRILEEVNAFNDDGWLTELSRV